MKIRLCGSCLSVVLLFMLQCDVSTVLQLVPDCFAFPQHFLNTRAPRSVTTGRLPRCVSLACLRDGGLSEHLAPLSSFALKLSAACCKPQPANRYRAIPGKSSPSLPALFCSFCFWIQLQLPTENSMNTCPSAFLLLAHCHFLKMFYGALFLIERLLTSISFPTVSLPHNITYDHHCPTLSFSHSVCMCMCVCSLFSMIHSWRSALWRKL